MKNKSSLLTLKQFETRFSPEEIKQIEAEVKYYNLLGKFRDAREKRGLTQEQLAKKAKINRTTLSKVETGYRNATIETLVKLANAMDLEIDLKLH